MSILVLVIGVATTSAQEFKPFKLGIGVGFTVPEGGGGMLFDLEPAYRVNDQFAVGLRLEAALMAKKVGDQKASASANASYTVNGQYYLSDEVFRPYVGLGFGVFNMASLTVDDSSGEIAAASKFGLYPRIGFDSRHFNLNLDYNLISATESSYDIGTGSMQDVKIKNSYVGFRLGLFLFGGRK